MPRRIGVLGSMFDPPHWGHFLVAEQVLEHRPDISDIWLMPAHTHPFHKQSTDPSHRLAMVRFLESSHMVVADDEIVRKGVSYTIDTVQMLKKNYSHEFFWIIGSDNLADFDKWKESKKLSASIPFLVFPRPGYPITNLPSGFSVIPGDVVVSGISSTDIRNRVKNGKSIRGLVPDEISCYIKDHGLYTH